MIDAPILRKHGDLWRSGICCREISMIIMLASMEARQCEVMALFCCADRTRDPSAHLSIATDPAAEKPRQDGPYASVTFDSVLPRHPDWESIPGVSCTTDRAASDTASDCAPCRSKQSCKRSARHIGTRASFLRASQYANNTCTCQTFGQDADGSGQAQRAQRTQGRGVHAEAEVSLRLPEPRVHFPVALCSSCARPTLLTDTSQSVMICQHDSWLACKTASCVFSCVR